MYFQTIDDIVLSINIMTSVLESCSMVSIFWRWLWFLILFVVTTQMELKPNAGSDRAWVWPVPSDFADEEAKQELLAIKFANSEST